MKSTPDPMDADISSYFDRYGELHVAYGIQLLCLSRKSGPYSGPLPETSTHSYEVLVVLFFHSRHPNSNRKL